MTTENRFTYVDQILLSRTEGGVDYGTERAVLAQRGNKFVLWNFSHKFWADRMSGYIHTGATLRLFNRSEERWHGKDEMIHEGGRLSAQLLRKYDDKMSTFLGIKHVSSRIKIRKTLIIDE